MSREAKLVRIADKICNVHDVLHVPPREWSVAWRLSYVDWTERVVSGCRGCHPELESHYDALVAEARRVLGGPDTA